MSTTSIYGIIKDNQLIYVGKSKCPIENFNRRHRVKYGNSIDMIILDEINSVNTQDWRPIEEYWITRAQMFNTLNNKNVGGGGAPFQTEETKQRMSLARKGESKPQGFGEKISKSYPKKPVIQFDLQGNFIKEWKTLTSAKKHYKGVANVVTGLAKSAGGYKWTYKN